MAAALGAHAGVVGSEESSVRVALAPSDSAHNWQRLLVQIPVGYPEQLPSLVFEHHSTQPQQPALAQAAWDKMLLRVWEGAQLATLQQVAECWLDVVGSMPTGY